MYELLHAGLGVGGNGIMAGSGSKYGMRITLRCSPFCFAWQPLETGSSTIPGGDTGTNPGGRALPQVTFLWSAVSRETSRNVVRGDLAFFNIWHFLTNV